MTTPTPVIVEPGNFLTAALWNSTVSAAMEWAFITGPPRFSGYANAWGGNNGGTDGKMTSTSPGTYVSVPLDTEVFDSAGGHSTITNPERYVIQVAGTYHVVASGGFSSSSTGNRSVRIGVNGVAGAAGGQVASPGIASNTWYDNVSALIPLNVGDYLSVQMWQNSGSALAVSTGSAGGPALYAVWLSP